MREELVSQSPARQVPAAAAPIARAGARADAGVWSALLFAGVVATVLWAPLPFGSVEPWSLGLVKLAILLLAAVWAVGCAARGALVVSSSPLQLVLYAAAALAFLQAAPVWSGGPASVDPHATWQAGWTLLAFGLFFSLALAALDRKSRLRAAALAIFWFGFAVAVFAIIQSLSGTTSIYWLRETEINFFGPYGNKNHFAGLMELLIPLGLGMLITGAVPRERRLLTAFAALVMGVALVLSRSRAGLFSFGMELIFLGMLALAFASRRGVAAWKAVAGVVVLAACIGLGIVWLGADSVAESLSTIPDEALSEEDLSRNGLWRDTAALVRDHRMVGTGIGAYATAFTAYTRSSGNAAVHQAHNDYLQVLADAGVVGGVLAILFVVGLGRVGFSAIQRRDPVIGGIALGATTGCFGLLVHSFFDFNLQIPSNALAFLFTASLVVRSASIDAGSRHLAVRRQV